MKKVKTNVLRILEQKHIDYETREYDYDDEHLSGQYIVSQVDLQADEIYKTLVLSCHNGYLVCCIPILEEIDLKKLAKVSGHKSVSMIHQKDLFNVTGYIRGGCSPIGMKRTFKTYFQEDMSHMNKVAVSAGKRGLQVIIALEELRKCVNGEYADVMRRGK